MTGDKADCLARIKALLPSWFGIAPTPVLDAFLSGPAWVLAWIYTLYIYAKLQTRLLTATDGWLDLIAYDFLGNEVRRRGDDDDAYRRRIISSLFRHRNTLQAVKDAVAAVTGNVPTVDEGTFAATITVDPGPATEDEVLAALDAVRPITVVFNLVLTGDSVLDLVSTEAFDALETEGGDSLETEGSVLPGPSTDYLIDGAGSFLTTANGSSLTT